MSKHETARILGALLPYRPTGTCFDDALDFLESLQHLPDFTIGLLHQFDVLHGICLIPNTDERFAHAWIEWPRRRVVLQGAIIEGERQFYEMPQAIFEATLRPQKFTRYSAIEAVKLNDQHNNYGPWVDEYIALCKDKP